ncbi:MAG: CocE/NonD family hydrolase C-terminal non-catalytic domain-containing protein, partial [Actinomycetota bacterium]
VGREGFVDEMMRLFDRSLKGDVVPDEPHAVIVQEAGGRWRGEDAWPPPDSTPFTMPLLGGNYLDAPGNFSGDDIGVDFPTDFPTGSTPLEGRGSWTFTQPLPYDVHLSGAPGLTLETDGRSPSKVVALLYDVAPDGSALMISRGASKLGPTGNVGFELSMQDWRVAQGHRLGLLLTGADDLWYDPTDTSLRPIHAIAGALSLPALRIARTSFIDGERGTRWGEIKHPISVGLSTITRRTKPADLPPPQEPS